MMPDGHGDKIGDESVPVIPTRRLDPPWTRRATTSSAPRAPRSRWSSMAAMPARTAAPPTWRSPALRDRFGERMRYVFRIRPLTDNDLAWRSAELAERAPQERFWKAHIELMTRSADLTEDDLDAVAAELGLEAPSHPGAPKKHGRAWTRTRPAPASAASGSRHLLHQRSPLRRTEGRDLARRSHARHARASHVGGGARFRELAALGRAAVADGDASVAGAVELPLGPAFVGLWERELGVSLGDWRFGMSLHQWVNDGLLTIFFLVVWLEIKREFTVGHLANRRSAALPIAAAFGGMVVPALIYLLLIPAGRRPCRSSGRRRSSRRSIRRRTRWRTFCRSARAP